MLIRGSLAAVCLRLCLCLIAAGAVFGQQYTITTLAGNGTEGFLDGSDLKAAQFNNPGALAIDSKGAIYIADTAGQRIRLISGGAVSTIGGNGTPGYSGSGAAATSANINSPGGIAVDSSGAVYIGESSNHVVRKIAVGGNITLLAGNALEGFGGADGSPAVAAQLDTPTGIAVDSAGNVYISDTGNSLIRRVDKNGNISNYVGGTGPTGGRINHPTGIAIDAAGALYIADTGNRRIAKYASNTLSTIAGNGSAGFSGDGGPATSAQLNNPIGVAVDATGSVYIADANNSRIRKVTPGGIIVTIAGKGGGSYTGDGGVATSAGLNFPRGVAVGTDGKVYIADTANDVIRVLTPLLSAAGGVTNAASFVQRVSPGALASIFGANFGTVTAQGELGLLSNALPTSLGGVSVTVNGTLAPLLFVSPGQVNFQVPWKTATGTANVAVVVNGGAGAAVPVPVQTAAPGLFTYEDGSAIVQNSDFSLNDAAHPIAAGGTIIAYLTGSGPVSPAVADGTPAGVPLSQITAAKSARIGTADARVDFAGLAPFFVGLVQFNIVVPAGLAAGTYPLTVTIDGQTSNAGDIVVK